jgi:hypothetical protein
MRGAFGGLLGEVSNTLDMLNVFCRTLKFMFDPVQQFCNSVEAYRFYFCIYCLS